MTTNILSPTVAPWRDAIEPVTTGPVLVATDGSEASEAAMAAGAMIARATGAELEIVSAFESGSPLLVAPELAHAMLAAEKAAYERHLERLARQIRTHLGVDDPLVHVVDGRASQVVPRIAGERRAALIVAAYGEHSMVSRILGTETPLRIARVADAPILCVPPGFVQLPRVVVIAVDLGVECVRAAAAARPLLGSATQIFLVHVKPKERLDMPADLFSEWEQWYERELSDAFARVTESLGVAADVSVTTAVRRGGTGREILTFAATAHADLLVAGHGHRSRFERFFGGSVASQLFRGAQCALLLAPDVLPESHLPFGEPGTTTELLDDRAGWLDALVRFSGRNAGCLVTVELHDRRLGAQIVAQRFRLSGVDYDWRDDAVELVLGGAVTGERHFAHVVRGPTSIAIQRGRDGRDRALCIESVDGQLLVLLGERG